VSYVSPALFKLNLRDHTSQKANSQDNNQGKDDTRNVANVPVEHAFDVWDLDGSMLKLYVFVIERLHTMAQILEPLNDLKG
jgi:hypothetical protein